MPEVRKVPARYVGAHSVILPATNGPYEDAEGNRFESTKLSPGNTLKVYPQEAWGQTLKWDPQGNAPLYFLGYGRVLLEQHAKPVDDEGNARAPYSAAELSALGYEFQPARTEHFEALEPPPEPDHEALAKLGLRAVQTAGIQVAPPAPTASAPAPAPAPAPKPAPTPKAAPETPAASEPTA